MHEGDDRADEPRADEHPAEPEEPVESAEDAAWREIVENYGDLVLDDAPMTDESVIVSFPEPFAFDSDADPDDPDSEDDLVPDDEAFVPPRPDLPHTTPERFLAWLGVLGSPVLAIVLVTIYTITGFVFPSWVIALLVLAFLGGFGYLIVTMSRDPGDPWDDGARL
ncbi:hypothetical protein AB3X52_07435 [Nocardioides sp. DS6]|uniref:DUF308 domain-containing protein n=1 Tax=Nocardioides eburneus TaxID=3231482 RepID=A0ABV3SYA9_9ACTN